MVDIQNDNLMHYPKFVVEQKKNEPKFVPLLVSWQCPIFPGRFQPSIFGDEKLNFCVRDENRWTFSLSSPEMVYLVIAHEILKYILSTLTTAYLELKLMLINHDIL